MANRNAAVGSGRTKGLIDARNGSRKNLAKPNDVHGGMHRQQGDTMIAGVSTTEAAQILGEDGGLGTVHGGGQPGTYPALAKAGHKSGNVPIHPGMTDEQRMEASTDKGPQILAEANQGARGNKHLPDTPTLIEDQGEPIRQPDCPTK